MSGKSTDNAPSAPDLSVWDSEKLPKVAPTGTPSPLREVYAAVADAVFHAHEARYHPMGDRLFFTDAIAVPLANAWQSARNVVAQNKIWLRTMAPEAFGVFQAALEEIAEINHVCGHVVLEITNDSPTDYLAKQPPFDAYSLIDQMEKETCRAAAEHGTGAGNRPKVKAGDKAETPKLPMTEPKGPKYWCGIFELSWDTLGKRFKTQQIRNEKLSTKSYRVAIDDLPEKVKAKFSNNARS